MFQYNKKLVKIVKHDTVLPDMSIQMNFRLSTFMLEVDTDMETVTLFPVVKSDMHLLILQILVFQTK